jgi:hypothetical protein
MNLYCIPVEEGGEIDPTYVAIRGGNCPVVFGI